MLRRKSLVILFYTLLLTQVIIIQPAISRVDISTVDNTKLDFDSTTNQISKSIVTPAPSGTEIVKTNVYNDGNMEEVESSGEPEAFSGSGSGIGEVNNSYQDDVHSGTYGGYVSTEGTKQWSSYQYSSRYFLSSTSEIAYLDKNIILDLWYNAKASPHFAQGAEQYIRFRFTTSMGNYYINYYLSRVSGLPLNSSTTGFYDMRGSLNSWINFNRNLTHDFIELFPAVPLATAYPRYIYFWTTSIVNPVGPTIMLYDDVTVTNGTGFNYFSDNGDFEVGTGIHWSNTESGPSSLYTTTIDYTEGNQAMNMSTYSPSTGGISYLFAEKDIYNGWGAIPKGWPSIQPGDAVLSFDWKYSDAPGVGQQQSYFYISSTNGSYYSYLYFVFGCEDDNFESSYSNYSYSSSSSYYIQAEGFGIRDTWHHFSFDYYEIYNTFNLTDIVPYYVTFYLDNYYVNDNLNQLLVDDFRLTTYPAGDVSFEANIFETTSDPFNYWIDPFSHIYENITSDAYHGNYAANITSHSSAGNIYIYKETFLPVVENLFTDFYWRLDKLTNNGLNAYSYIRLEIDDSDYLFYVLGNNTNYNPTNSTDFCFYLVDGRNQLGSWNNLFRNVYDDVIAYFGVGDHNITQIYLSSYATGAEVASTIFDYIHFVRDIAAPVITSPSINPIAPEYDDTVDISVNVQDNIMVQEVELIVRVDGGSWVPTPMTLVSGDYTATIPEYDYGTTIDYYFVSTDRFGLYTQLGSDTSPYSYVVADTVNPTLILEAPPESQVLNGTITFNITDAYDLGSGIASFEVELNGTVVYDSIDFPGSYAWDTETFENGEYPIIFRLEDNAGNVFVVDYTYTVYNPPTWFEQFITFSTSPLGIFSYSAGGALIIGIVVLSLVLRARKKKRLAA